MSAVLDFVRFQWFVFLPQRDPSYNRLGWPNATHAWKTLAKAYD